MLSVKVLLPSFRVLRSNTLVLDKNKKGRILLEWTPRTADGTFTFHVSLVIMMITTLHSLLTHNHPCC